LKNWSLNNNYLHVVRLESQSLTIVFNRFFHNSKDNWFNDADEWVWILWEQKMKESHSVIFFKMK